MQDRALLIAKSVAKIEFSNEPTRQIIALDRIRLINYPLINFKINI